jgi:hypothetical protein
LLQLPVFATIRPVFTHEPRRGSRQFHFAGQCQRKRERNGRRDGITATTLFLKPYLPTRLENWRPASPIRAQRAPALPDAPRRNASCRLL